MTPEVEERLKAIETQMTLVVASLQELGQQVGLLLARLSKDVGG